MQTILIIEDVAMNVELLVQLLEDDYHILIANDGQTGVELARAELPDLILMDMSLPVMDGWEATAFIKKDDAMAHIPVFGLSAHAMSSDAERAYAAGCNEYLTKPLDEDLLFDILEAYLGAPG